MTDHDKASPQPTQTPAEMAQGARVDLTRGEKDTLARIASARAAGVQLNQFWLDFEASRVSVAPSSQETETRFITKEDREYAEGLLDDLRDGLTSDEAAQWFCKARVENERRWRKSASAAPSPQGAAMPDGAPAPEFDAEKLSDNELQECMEEQHKRDAMAARVYAPAAPPFDPSNHHNALLCPYCNPQGLKFASAAKAPTRQYYYRANGCPATHNGAPDCICWHDEGTGPLADRPLIPGRAWRDKPELHSPADKEIEVLKHDIERLTETNSQLLAQVEETTSKLDDMTDLLKQFIYAYEEQDADNFTDSLRSAYAAADAALSSTTRRPDWCQGADSVCHHPVCTCMHLPSAQMRRDE